jgi:hypothetical protein
MGYPIDRLCVPLNLTTSKYEAISIFIKNMKKNAFSLEYVSLHKKSNFPLLLLLNICKLSSFISYKCVILINEDETSNVIIC